MKRRALLVTAALVAAVAVLLLVSLPPARLALGDGGSDGTVAGNLHIHTNRSDGRSSPAEIAAVAAKAGLKFVVFTDHGDATRPPDRPIYRAGVLCLDGVEISTNGGHYLAFDMPVSPYPLAGDPRDVIEDVDRLGGFGVAAHPDSPKSELRWREWTAPFDGIEIVNPDTGWRAHLQEAGWRPKLRLIEALVAYPFRSAEAIATLLDDSPGTLARWTAITARRRLVALAGVDAHAKLALRDVDPGDNRLSLAVPSYDASLRTLSVRVRPERPLAGDAASDARTLMAAIRAGHLYTAVDAFAGPASFDFSASNQRGSAREGDELIVGGPLTLRVRSNAPPNFETVVWQGARALTSRRGEADFTVTVPEEPAVYRVAIRAADRLHQPAWVVSNPIYVRSPVPPGRLPARPAATTTRSLFDGQPGTAWRFEADPMSRAAIDVVPAVPGSELRLRYGLGGGRPGGQFAALVVDTGGGLAAYDRLTFTARADQPMRISVQIRVSVTASADERWQRSVYLDADDEDRTVFFDDLTPVGETRTRRPPLADVHSIVFAVEMTNTKPGSSGRVWIKRAALQK